VDDNASKKKWNSEYNLDGKILEENELIEHAHAQVSVTG
jgi:hypothetical protein